MLSLFQQPLTCIREVGLGALVGEGLAGAREAHSGPPGNAEHHLLLKNLFPLYSLKHNLCKLYSI